MTARGRIIPAGVTVLGALGLIGSLFLTWSHQLSQDYAGAFTGAGAFAGVPRDPTAWQVYSTADVLLALLGAGLCLLGPLGSRGQRLGGLIAAVLGAAFVLHALGAPPTNGVIAATPPGASPPASGTPAGQLAAPANRPSAGVGETVALAGLALAGTGLGLSLLGRSAPTPRPRARARSRSRRAAAPAPR